MLWPPTAPNRNYQWAALNSDAANDRASKRTPEYADHRTWTFPGGAKIRTSRIGQGMRLVTDWSRTRQNGAKRTNTEENRESAEQVRATTKKHGRERIGTPSPEDDLLPRRLKIHSATRLVGSLLGTLSRFMFPMLPSEPLSSSSTRVAAPRCMWAETWL
jgi:hypothetical protein